MSRRDRGGRDRRDRALLNAREPPPAVFWFLLYRYKRNSPAGEIHTCLFVARQNGRMISAPTKAECQIRKADAIRPTPKRKTARSGRPQAAPTQKRKAQRRGRRFHLPNSFPTGAEAKRSFAQSSLPSFLSRKRERLPGRDTATAGAHIKSWKNSLSAYRERRPPRCGGWAPHRWNRW